MLSHSTLNRQSKSDNLCSARLRCRRAAACRRNRVFRRAFPELKAHDSSMARLMRILGTWLRCSRLVAVLQCFFLAAVNSVALSPQESLKAMKVADGFEVFLVASEPEIRQPLSTTFDERGRMWVIQYLQYPTP